MAISFLPYLFHGMLCLEAMVREGGAPGGSHNPAHGPFTASGAVTAAMGTCPLLCSSWYEHTVKEHHWEGGKGSRPGELTKSHRWVEQSVHQYLESHCAQSSRGAGPAHQTLHSAVSMWGRQSKGRLCFSSCPHTSPALLGLCTACFAIAL